jgi:NAD(P)-dependent dehydrogenase (short-subunit alcohol dehydrogenase family)
MAVVKLCGSVIALDCPRMSASFSSTPRTALVTGAGKRLGREIALGLARAGWRVAVHYRSSEAEALQTAADCLQAFAEWRHNLG